LAAPQSPCLIISLPFGFYIYMPCPDAEYRAENQPYHGESLTLARRNGGRGVHSLWGSWYTWLSNLTEQCSWELLPAQRRTESLCRLTSHTSP